ncbi:hypothetical protein GGF46_002003 [Coemansia sp. RSA 552]|nr:hypothetical protein GGF46_002003 [Coemansia sp. RSA 552]
MTTDGVMLDFENAEVRNSDFESLKPEGWLTGEIINFYWTFLERREFRTEPSVLFLGTYTAYRIANAESAAVTDNISMQLSGELIQRQLILIPLNHRSHWSLLVYCRLTHTFYHYDSISRYNRNFAERAAGRFLRVLEPHLKEGFYFKSMQTPQQNNDFDCGIYVLAIAEELARRFINNKRSSRMAREKRVLEKQHQYHRHGTDAGQRNMTMKPSMSAAHAQQQQQQQQQRRNQSMPPVSRVPVHPPTTTAPLPTTSRSPLISSAAPGRALASDLLMPRFGKPFTGFPSPFESTYRPSDLAPPEPLLRGGGPGAGSGSSGHSSAHTSKRSREERLKMEEKMMERAGLPRDFWLVTVEDIEYPHCMRRRIRSLVLDLQRQAEHRTRARH